MGNSIATAMVEKQKEVQEDMMKKQLKMQLRGQERMRRMMIASQIAATRELLWWQGGFGLVVLTGLTGYSIKNGFPKIAALPLLAYSTVLAYQIDFAYGNKTDRINNTTMELLQDPKNWYTPALPVENDPLLQPELMSPKKKNDK